MFNQEEHKIILIKILKEIYSDPKLRNALGFKGGTAAYLFYELPRFSVDLDFDLRQEIRKKEVFERMGEILSRFGELVERIEKKNTLFFLLRYRKEGRLIKIEVSKRPSSSQFSARNYLGIPVLVMEKEAMTAGKLDAFLKRSQFASRDLFDLWFFLSNGWKIDGKVVEEKTGLPLSKALKIAIEKAQKIKPNQLLQGLGELVEIKQKNWVKENLKKEAVFWLRYQSKEVRPFF